MPAGGIDCEQHQEAMCVEMLKDAWSPSPVTLPAAPSSFPWGLSHHSVSHWATQSLTRQGGLSNYS